MHSVGQMEASIGSVKLFVSHLVMSDCEETKSCGQANLLCDAPALRAERS